MPQALSSSPSVLDPGANIPEADGGNTSVGALAVSRSPSPGSREAEGVKHPDKQSESA